MTLREEPPQGKSAPCQFGGHRHSRRGDLLVLVSHMILQDHLIKGSCDLMGRSPLE